MKRHCMIWLALGTAAVFAATAPAQTSSKHANPGSLWSDAAADPLRDRVARRPGDIITILINEFSTSSFSAQTNASKNDRTNIQQGIGPLLNLIPALGIGASSTVAGQGQTAQSGRMVARISAMVVEVMPNGQMVIEGTRSVATNKETQTFRLTGIIRPQDVRPDNTILSQHIAQAEIRAEGKGMISDRQRRGILTRLLDWLF
jgi:flagellar L-ring protein FlgH